MLLNMKCPPITKVLVFAYCLLSPLAEANAISNCFSFIPYAKNDSFIQLPANKNFCFHYSTKKIHFSTDQFGGRKVGSNAHGDEIVAFGESQLLGLDFSDTESDKENATKHDLSVLFPSSRMTIYAAPNNGPLQAIEQMRKLYQLKPFTGKRIVIGFNYGTDIFRIDPNWKPEKFVPLDMSQLDRSFYIPGYHDIALFIARLKGVKFGSTVSNSDTVRDYYKKLGQRQRNDNIQRWLLKLQKSEVKSAGEVSLILYPPYWYIGAGQKAKATINRDYESLACKAYLSGIFTTIYVSALPDEHTKLAEDNRHFLSGETSFQRYKC